MRSHHIAVKSAKFGEMKAFYADVLGFPLVGRFPGRDIVFFDIGGTTIELIRAAEGQAVQPALGLIHLAFEVDDVDATYESLKAQGIEFHIEPRTVEDARIAFFRDPDGNALELFHSPTLTWK